MFAEHNVTVQVEDEENTELVFPVSLVDRAETFDALMSDVAEAIERGDDPTLARPPDHGIGERQIVRQTIDAMQRLHTEGRNHIWAYYTRNLNQSQGGMCISREVSDMAGPLFDWGTRTQWDTQAPVRSALQM